MTEEQILNAIANACEDNTLRFQIIIHDKILHVYINRPTQVELDYQELKSKIYGILTKTFPLEFSQIWLYCRVLGEIEADWQAVLEIEINLDFAQMSAMMQAITGAVEATNLIVDKIEQELENPESFASYPLWDFEELPTTTGDNGSEFGSDFDLELLESIEHVALELDLHKYCFISNQRLLYAVLNAPQENIARLVDTFDRFEQSIKRSQLPALEIFFHQSINPNLESLEPEVQSWWIKLTALDSDRQRQLAIWLSRYCLHPEQTISTISKVFVPQVARKPKQLWQTRKLIKHKLSQQIPEQNQNGSEAKSGLFSSWIMLLRKFFQKVKPTK
jgi:hypothetical protein